MSLQRLRLEICGAVQGVGFRPFVYRLAIELGLTGWVLNDTLGVFIEVEGIRTLLESFLERISVEKPPLSMIYHMDALWLDPIGYEQFEICHSAPQGNKSVLVLPDVATCADCLHDMRDPHNRRYRYPFTNCTNCGPRFTIIQALPYDRPHTTMRLFSMCSDCQAEYENPLDRRFHAQPNACPVCGPHVELWSVDGRQHTAETALRETVAALHAGQIVAVKGLGGFHLMVDARNSAAVARLRERKHRRDKPLALMVRNLDHARLLCEISSQSETLLTSTESPIVLLPRKKDAPLAENIAADTSNLGLMLPYTPLHHLLLQVFDAPIVATSGNLSDEPICTDEHEAIQQLGHIADLFLVHNRPIERHVDDSIVWIIRERVQLLRRARGYAPLPVIVPRPLPVILAVGGHLKNSVALSVTPTVDNPTYSQIFISQHIGDLETPQASDAFERVIADFLRLYEAQPVAIAHDMHPDYVSTRWAVEAEKRPALTGLAKNQNITLIPVQHHHAHLAACLADNGIEGPALGVTWDGTGYGGDGTIWGGEFLLGDVADFRREAHIHPFRLLGGSAAVREPRRIALSLLWEVYGEAMVAWDHLAVIGSFTAMERKLFAQLLQRGFNAPVTTSVGRLFDGFAALIGLHPYVTFEGQAAMALEHIADVSVREAYPLAYSHPPSLPHIIDWRPLIEATLDDLQHSVSQAIMAARFHNTLVQAIGEIAKIVAEPRVALTGGCFQNRLLVERSIQCLQNEGFEVILHHQVPPNDGGISLGQVIVAAAKLSHV